MCFGGGDEGPTSTPAPYAPDQSHTAGTFDKSVAPPKPVVPETPKTEPSATDKMVGTGLNVKGM